MQFKLNVFASSLILAARAHDTFTVNSVTSVSVSVILYLFEYPILIFIYFFNINISILYSII